MRNLILCTLMIFAACSKSTKPVSPNIISSFHYPLNFGNIWQYKQFYIADSAGIILDSSSRISKIQIYDTIRINDQKCFRFINWFRPPPPPGIFDFPLFYGDHFINENGDCIQYLIFSNSYFSSTIIPGQVQIGKTWIDSIPTQYDSTSKTFIFDYHKCEIADHKSIITEAGQFNDCWEVIVYADQSETTISYIMYFKSDIGLVLFQAWSRNSIISFSETYSLVSYTLY